MEHLIVEWAPLPGRAPIAEVLPPVSSRLVTRRIIHAAGPEVDAVNAACGRTFHECAAKNVGVRRAAGAYVVLTNQDIIFLPELAAAVRDWIMSGLSRTTFARCDRLDISVAEDEAYPVVDRVEEAIRRRHAIHARGASTFCSGSPLRTLFAAATRPAPDYELPEKSLLLPWSSSTGGRGLHTNASGDFLLVAKTSLIEAGSLAEGFPWRSHLDSLSIFRLWGLGLGQVIFRMPAIAVHVDHGRNEPASPEWHVVEPYVDGLLQGDPYPGQPAYWGLADSSFDETEARWKRC
ncbi:MAG: glycosyltransferase family 2 protein [Thermomicrobiales bacterium]